MHAGSRLLWRTDLLLFTNLLIFLSSAIFVISNWIFSSRSSTMMLYDTEPKIDCWAAKKQPHWMLVPAPNYCNVAKIPVNMKAVSKAHLKTFWKASKIEKKLKSAFLFCFIFCLFFLFFTRRLFNYVRAFKFWQIRN